MKTEIGDTRCGTCGKTLKEVDNKGRWLTRVNLKGESGIWKCMPSCLTSVSQEEAVLGAILGDVPLASTESK